MKTKKTITLTKPKFVFVLLACLGVGLIGGSGLKIQQTKQTQFEKHPKQVLVTRVIDGDTVEIEDGRSIRLYGISCPETKEEYFEEATEFTKQKVLNKTVSIEYQPNYEDDKFGRLLGYVLLEDNQAYLPRRTSRSSKIC